MILSRNKVLNLYIFKVNPFYWMIPGVVTTAMTILPPILGAKWNRSRFSTNGSWTVNALEEKRKTWDYVN